MEKVLVIIPAKADSTRFIGKNKQVIQGKTLVEHAINFAKSNQHNPRIVVSTEDPETKKRLKSANLVYKTYLEKLKKRTKKV